MSETEIFIANALFIQGLNFASHNVFHKLTGWYMLKVANTRLEWSIKPLFSCKPCMSSIWGIGFWITSYEWYYYPVWVGCLAGGTLVINKIVDK